MTTSTSGATSDAPTNSSEQYAPITTAAAALLTERYGAPVAFTQIECISEADRRNRLFRCTLDAPTAGLPPTLIIKQVVAEKYDPAAINDWHTQRFFHDWAGAEFLSSVSPTAEHSPRFYGGHRDLGFILLEDLGTQHRSLVEPLLDEDAASAERALLKYVTALGRMHADTMGKEAEFYQILHAANPALAALPKPQVEQEKIQKFVDVLTTLAIPTDAALLAELQRVLDTVNQPGVFGAYIHHDPCPDNLFDTGDRLRLLDFEFGRFGHALIDAAYIRIFFPSCWCCNQIPAPVIARLEAVYRTELVRGCPAAADDELFKRTLAEVCGYWLLETHSWVLAHSLTADDSPWGITTTRARILGRLAAFVATASEFDQLPAYRSAASRLLALLQARWPENEPMPFYPAFRPTIV